MLNQIYYLVPIDLCEFVLRNKFFSTAKLYLHLKSTSDGKIRINSTNRQLIADALGCTTRTLHTNLIKLRERNWIGFNPTTRMYFIRGFNKLKEIEGWDRSAGVWWNKEKLSDSKAFFIGACLGYLANKQKARVFNEQKEKHSSERKKEGSYHSELSIPTHYPIACDAIAQIYGVSKSTAYHWKKLAHEAAHIHLKKSVRLISKSVSDLPFIKEGYNEDAHRYFLGFDGYVYFQEIDQVAAGLLYKRRRQNR